MLYHSITPCHRYKSNTASGETCMPWMSWGTAPSVLNLHDPCLVFWPNMVLYGVHGNYCWQSLTDISSCKQNVRSCSTRADCSFTQLLLSMSATFPSLTQCAMSYAIDAVHQMLYSGIKFPKPQSQSGDAPMPETLLLLTCRRQPTKHDGNQYTPVDTYPGLHNANQTFLWSSLLSCGQLLYC